MDTYSFTVTAVLKSRSAHDPRHGRAPGERRGHITRGARAGDRRAVLVELTPTGRLTANTIQKTLTDLEHRAFCGR
ncbi:hypothetical protein [Streptomyces lunaelactis]|uniref:hypothetical protein n=1 Tax=Streptomyces lunaelactis TaxID=1535768 RepID=UPI001584E052|nr:hypothetical protein [Streptomyces lunaelactis]NUK86594.1 hypothetical protein [Streptomyces lunaelactis]